MFELLVKYTIDELTESLDFAKSIKDDEAIKILQRAIRIKRAI